MTLGVFSDPPCRLKSRKATQPGDEIIICAAVRMPDGYVVMGHRHDGALQYASRIPRYADVQTQQDDQGFVTSTGRFVGRKEAHVIHTGQPGMLFSEDLY